MFPNEMQARKEIVYYSHKTHAAGLVTATDGNLSVRLDDQHVLDHSRRAFAKRICISTRPIVIDMEGNLVAGDRKPSTEYKVHLEAYQQRPDVQGGDSRASLPRRSRLRSPGRRLIRACFPKR